MLPKTAIKPDVAQLARDNHGHVPKSAWGPGPWHNEPDRLSWQDAATNLPCLAIRGPASGSWCGYVGVPPGHPWHGAPPDSVDIQVHGGLTYGDMCRGDICHVPQPGQPHDVYWLGFDCAHWPDRMPAIEALFEGNGGPHMMEMCTYKDEQYVREEILSLARQVAAAGGKQW